MATKVVLQGWKDEENSMPKWMCRFMWITYLCTRCIPFSFGYSSRFQSCFLSRFGIFKLILCVCLFSFVLRSRWSGSQIWEKRQYGGQSRILRRWNRRREDEVVVITVVGEDFCWSCWEILPQLESKCILK